MMSKAFIVPGICIVSCDYHDPEKHRPNPGLLEKTASDLFNIYRAGKAFSRLLLARTKGEYIPWYVFLLVTERCNLHCNYCFVNSPDRRRNRDGPIQEWSTAETCRVIDKLYALGTRFLNIQGGEPLLRKDLEEIVDYANHRGMITDIYTNGLLIHKHLKALKKFFRVTVSLEGDAPAHDLDRGPGTYAKIIENLRLLHDNNIRFSINYTVSKNNADMHSFGHVLGIAERYGAMVAIGEAVYKFDPCFRKSHIPKEQLKEFWEGVRKFKLQGYPIQKTLASIDLCMTTADTITAEDIYKKGDSIAGGRKISPCMMGRYWVFLDVDGMLYPCSNLFNRFGRNIFELGARDAWDQLSSSLDCQVCRGSVSCGVNDFLAFDLETLVEAMKHFYRFHIRKGRHSRPSRINSQEVPRN